MNFSCVQNKIQKATARTNMCVARNVDLPVLSCVLLTTTNDQLLLQSTDIEHAVTITIPAKVESEGTVAVPSDVLTRLVGIVSKKDDTVSISLNESTVQVNTGSGKAEVHIMDHAEFPAIPHIETDSDTRQFSFPIKDFIQALQSVSFAASHSNIKPELSSVFTSYQTGVLYFVCTDGFRLIEKKIKIDLGAEDFSFLLPVKSAGMITKIFDTVEDEREAQFFVTDNQIAIETGSIYFTCRLVSGNFPDYKQLLPKDKDTSAVMLKDDLAEVMKLSTIFSNEFHEVLLNVDPKQKLCEVTSQNQTVGVNQTNIPAALEGESVSMKFNYRYVTDVLPSLSTDSLEMSFTDPNRPIKITSVPDTQLTYIVMPINK